jgi:hypothetical protein
MWAYFKLHREKMKSPDSCGLCVVWLVVEAAGVVLLCWFWTVVVVVVVVVMMSHRNVSVREPTRRYLPRLFSKFQKTRRLGTNLGSFQKIARPRESSS